MAGLSIAQPVTLDAAGEQIVTGAADLSLNGGISVTAGTLSSTGGTLSLPSGATLASGASFSTSNTTLNLGGSLAVADTWTSTNHKHFINNRQCIPLQHSGAEFGKLADQRS